MEGRLKGGGAVRCSGGEEAVGQCNRIAGVLIDLESWILKAESGGNRGGKDSWYERSKVGVDRRRYYRQEARTYWDKHRRKPEKLRYEGSKCEWSPAGRVVEAVRRKRKGSMKTKASKVRV